MPMSHSVLQKQNITFYDNEDGDYLDNAVYRCDSEIILDTDSIVLITPFYISNADFYLI
jgi:hypothetical protein